jgi:hypothetical protein
MATRVDQQLHMEDEELGDPQGNLLELYRDWQDALKNRDDLKEQRQAVNKAEKSFKDAKEALFAALPLDDKTHRWRLGQFVTVVTPPAAPGTVKRTPRHRLTHSIEPIAEPEGGQDDRDGSSNDGA